MSEGPQNSRKRNKKRYMSSQYKRFKRSRELEVGMQGVLITCNNKNQRPCTAEALDLLTEYADQLYGPEDNFEASGEKDAEEEEDVEVALKKEVAELNARRTNQEKRFQVLDSGAYNVIFIRTQNIDPDKLIHYILTDLHATKKKKSRLILRMLPVIGTCRAYQEDIVKYVTVFLVPWFKDPNCATFQIVYKARNNNQNKREEVIKSIAGVLGKLNQNNKVNLMDPELTVVVEVIKAVCCISVVRDYKLYRKYNVYEIVKEDAPKSDVVATKTDANTSEVTKKESGGESDHEESKVKENQSEKEPQETEEVKTGEGAGGEDSKGHSEEEEANKKDGEDEDGEDANK